jgi:hypothetical protein
LEILWQKDKEKNSIFTKNTAVLLQRSIIILVFKKKRHFCDAKIGKKRGK